MSLTATSLVWPAPRLETSPTDPNRRRKVVCSWGRIELAPDVPLSVKSPTAATNYAHFWAILRQFHK